MCPYRPSLNSSEWKPTPQMRRAGALPRTEPPCSQNPDGKENTSTSRRSSRPAPKATRHDFQPHRPVPRGCDVPVMGSCSGRFLLAAFFHSFRCPGPSTTLGSTAGGPVVTASRSPSCTRPSLVSCHLAVDILAISSFWPLKTAVNVLGRPRWLRQ